MRLEDLTITLRPRQPWEAVDLGCTLVRRDYGRILSLWFLSVVPLWILLAVALRDHPGWFGFAVWWLKPLYDRLPLYHLSRAAFGARPTLKQSLREWPRLWSRFLLSALLFRRLSFIRSFALPVWMLEGQRGHAVGKRLKALATDGGGSGSSLTWVFVKLELAVFFGITFLVSNIGPSSSLPDWSDFFQNPEAYLEVTPAQQWATNLIYMLAVTLVEPFYVGGGFGLYLNSRTKIEGWDIELTFRRMAERLRPAVMTGLVLCLLCAPALIQAQGADDAQEVNATLQEILARPEFKEHSRTQSVWVPDSLSGSAPSAPALDWLGPVFYGLGIGLLVMLIYFIARWAAQNRHIFNYSGGPGRSGPQGPRILMGMDIASENLPDDIVGAARAAWAAGRLREALSLLYRGSLSRLVEQQRLPIRDSDTEDDCLHHVAQAGDGPVTSFFRQLTLVWVRAAYAGREAQASEFDRLCSTWPFPPPSARKRQSSAVAVNGTVAMLLVMPFLAGCSGHWEEITIPQGYKGKARSDPFLAAQELLEAYGHSTQRLPVLKAFPDSANGVILVSGESGMPEARARQLLEWVDQGGHLIYTMAGCAPYNDWGLFSSLSTLGYEGSKDRADPVLEGLGVTVLGWGDLDKLKETLSAGFEKDKREKQTGADKKEKQDTADKDGVVKRIEEPRDVPTTRSQIRMGKKTFAVDFPDMLHFVLGRKLGPAEYASGTADKAVCLSLVRGFGRVTLLNHARPLRSRYLDENDHASWLLALVGEDAQEVQFIVSLQRSFWSLLWSRAWMPLIGLVLLIAVWLWRSLPRFGPLRQAVLHETRHFADHIGALGQFFYRIHQTQILLTAAGDVVRTRAIRKHPHLAHQNDEALVEMLAGISSLPKERIRAAFEVPEKPGAHQTVRQLQDLQALREVL